MEKIVEEMTTSEGARSVASAVNANGRELLEKLMDEYGFIVWILAALVALFAILSIVTYVIRSLTYGAISKSRGLKNSWLAWFPVGWSWVLGNIARDADKKNGITRKWSSALVWQELIIYAVAVFAGAASAFLAFSLVNGDITIRSFLLVSVFSWLISFVGAMFGVLFIISNSICTYKMFETIVPDKALKYMTLSILVPVAYPVLLLKCRDAVMPKPVAPAAPVRMAAPAPVQQTPDVPVAQAKPVQNSLADTNNDTPSV